eukprot:superscaffoldBa00008789_g23625
MAATLVEHVVADAGAFLKKAPLQDIGRNIYTLRDVVDEIRDKPTRRMTEFSKKTGDYPSLSATDIKVLALTYQLQLEHVGSQHLRKEPEVKVNIQSTRRHPETPLNVAGFHFPSKKAADGSSGRQSQTETSNSVDSDEFNSFQFWRAPLLSIDDELLGLL